MLLTPVLLVAVLLVVQLALWMHTANVATAAANRAVGAAAPVGGSAAAGRAAATAFSAEAGARVDGIAVTRRANAVEVVVRLRLPQVVPGVPGTVTRSVVAPVERFVPEPER